MRLISAVLLVLCGGILGVWLSTRYKRRVEALSCCMLFLERMAALLSLETVPTGELFARLAAMEELKELSFIRETAERLTVSCDFPTVFMGSLAFAQKDGLLPEDCAILKPLCGLIGAYELPRQLDGIEAVKTAVSSQQKKAKSISEKEGKLVRSLGILGGVAAAIFVI